MIRLQCATHDGMGKALEYLYHDCTVFNHLSMFSKLIITYSPSPNLLYYNEIKIIGFRSAEDREACRCIDNIRLWAFRGYVSSNLYFIIIQQIRRW